MIVFGVLLLNFLFVCRVAKGAFFVIVIVMCDWFEDFLIIDRW